MSFASDFQWAQQFIPRVKQILGPLLLREAELDIDQHEATDLIVLKARDMRIGVRLRRKGFATRYGSEFTIRKSRDNGARTEWQKIMYDGWGDWLFYGHESEATPGDVAPWLVVDLDRLRGKLIKTPWSKLERERVCGSKSNGDGSHFVWFDIRRCGDVLVTSSGDVMLASEPAALDREGG